MTMQTEIFGNSFLAYGTSLAIFAGGVVLARILQCIIFKRLKALTGKTKSKIDDFAVQVAEKTILPLLYFGALFFAVFQLQLTPSIEHLTKAAAVILLSLQVTRLILAVSIYALEQLWFRPGTRQSGTPVSSGVMTVARLVIWGGASVFVLDNLGFNVAAVIAGLGIGGIAVALAAQTILGDLFNYFVIFFDRPFEEGDFIVVDDFLGTIEHIGIKSTRIRSLSGEQLVISNSNLTSSRIRNYKRMAERRVLFKIGVTYQTSMEQIKKIPPIIEGIIRGMESTRFDRAHFKEFGDFSLNVEVVYFVCDPDFNKYMDIQQKINWTIKEIFEREGIEFAYPTQTVFDYRIPYDVTGKKGI